MKKQEAIIDAKMTDTMQALNLLEITVLVPKKGNRARVKIYDTRFQVKKIIVWNYEFENALHVAIDWLNRNTTLKLHGYGLTKKHYFITVLPENHVFTSLLDAEKPQEAPEES